MTFQMPSTDVVIERTRAIFGGRIPARWAIIGPGTIQTGAAIGPTAGRRRVQVSRYAGGGFGIDLPDEPRRTMLDADGRRHVAQPHYKVANPPLIADLAVALRVANAYADGTETPPIAHLDEPDVRERPRMQTRGRSPVLHPPEAPMSNLHQVSSLFDAAERGAAHWHARLEFVEGSSAKFWQIVGQRAGDVTVSWGRLGTDGQSQVVSFAEAKKRIAEKMRKGYQLASVDWDVPNTARAQAQRQQRVETPQDRRKAEAKAAGWKTPKGKPFQITLPEGTYFLPGTQDGAREPRGLVFHPKGTNDAADIDLGSVEDFSQARVRAEFHAASWDPRAKTRPVNRKTTPAKQQAASGKVSLAALLARAPAPKGRGSASKGPVRFTGAFWDRGEKTVTWREGADLIEVQTGAGSDDTVSIWRWADQVYVLAERRGMPYIGLEHFAFFPNEGKWTKMGEVFLDTDDAIESALGDDGFDLDGPEKVRRLVNYL